MKKKIDVVMLLQHYFQEGTGGAERQVASLVPYLQDLDVQLHVICRHRKNIDIPDVEQIDNVTIYRTPYLKFSVLSSGYFILFALNQIRKIKPDVLHAHSLFSPATIAMLSKRLYKIPSVAKVLRGGVLGDVIRVKKKPFGERRLKNIARDIDGLISISDEITDELIEEGIPPEKCYDIPNGVDIERFKPLSPAEKQAQKASMGITQSPIVIFVGRLVPAKRVNNLITSWKDVRKQHPSAQLLILGKGAERKKLEAMAGEGITFVGAVEKVEDWLQIADLYVLPSVAEGLSNSLLEAMASALPIVATSVGDAPKLISEGQSGWCVPPDDVPALTTALTNALNVGDGLPQMGLGNRERIIQDYQLKNTAQKLRNLYDEVMS